MIKIRNVLNKKRINKNNNLKTGTSKVIDYAQISTKLVRIKLCLFGDKLKVNLLIKSMGCSP